MVDSQYTDRSERIGMLYHENVYVAAAAFDTERVPLHASGLQAPDGRVTLFGGTGGVGKTSLELHVGLRSGYRFLADDIAVLDANGLAYPNLAYPKIYGYNAPPSSPIRRSVVQNRSPLDRAHWALHSLRGPAQVRRRISPASLFAGVSPEGGPLSRYVILARESRPDIQLDLISPAQAAEMSTAILATELATLLKHLRWHELNRLLLELPPLVRADDMLSRWRELYLQAFMSVECLVARIPMSIPHDVFLTQMTDRLLPNG